MCEMSAVSLVGCKSCNTNPCFASETTDKIIRQKSYCDPGRIFNTLKWFWH